MPATEDLRTIATALSLSGSGVATDEVLNSGGGFEHVWYTMQLTMGSATSVVMSMQLMNEAGEFKDYYDADGGKIIQTFTADFDGTRMFGNDTPVGNRQSPPPMVAHGFCFRFVGTPTINTATVTMSVYGWRHERVIHGAYR